MPVDENHFQSPETTASSSASAVPGSDAAIGMMVFSGIFLVLMVLTIGRLLLAVAVGYNPLPARPETAGLATTVAVWAAVLTVSNAVVFYGANQMRTGGSRRWAWAACVLSCIPFLSPCYFVGIPFGVWGVIALRRASRD